MRCPAAAPSLSATADTVLLMASISSAIDPVVSRMNASSIDLVAIGARLAVRCKTSKLSSPCVERMPSALPSAQVARAVSESPTSPTALGKIGVRPDGVVRSDVECVPSETTMGQSAIAWSAASTTAMNCRCDTSSRV